MPSVEGSCWVAKYELWSWAEFHIYTAQLDTGVGTVYVLSIQRGVQSARARRNRPLTVKVQKCFQLRDIEIYLQWVLSVYQ